MKRSKYYDLRLPERGARAGEANDAADIEDLAYDLGVIDAELERQRRQDETLERGKAAREELARHAAAAVLEHPDGSVTDEKLGARAIEGTTGLLSELLSAVGQAIRAATGAQAWNGAPAASLAELAAGKADRDNVLARDNAEAYTPAAPYHPATKRYVDDTLREAGSGDMVRSVYDADGDGVVDDARRLGGEPPAYYAEAARVQALVDGGTPAGAVDGGTY